MRLRRVVISVVKERIRIRSSIGSASRAEEAEGGFEGADWVAGIFCFCFCF